MMTGEEVLSIVRKDLDGGDLKGFTYKLDPPAPYRRNPKEWEVVVHWYGAGGGYIDGPSILVVNPVDGSLRNFNDDFEKPRKVTKT